MAQRAETKIGLTNQTRDSIAMSLGPRPRTYGNLGAPDCATGQAIIRSEEGDDGKPPDQQKVMRISRPGSTARERIDREPREPVYTSSPVLLRLPHTSAPMRQVKVAPPPVRSAAKIPVEAKIKSRRTSDTNQRALVVTLEVVRRRSA